MTIAEKITRAKTDYDEVHEAGKKAEYDAFWDAFQDSTANHVCAYSGTYWSKNTFKPKNDIVINGKGATQLFFYHGWWNSPYDLDAQLKECGVVLDLSNATGFSETFRNACFTKLPEISTVSASSLQGMFNGMQWLKEIVNLVLKDDGSQTFTSTYSGETFEGCSQLESINITGTIGQDISVQWCPLNKASITNVINALSASATGKTATFKKTAKEAAFTADEWAAVIADKTNWTFSLV